MTPSQFYKQHRPDLFSDSEIITKATLQREFLAYELSKISTNQKQDEFETLCRRLAEKLISPNLIPQVGPTGGGDGKTDSETYPISESIAMKWYTPENGWDKDENWAFAISAKEAWKGKVKSDVKKIVETNRGYTRIYFISNQLISSKKRKDAQDELINEFHIDIVILDGEWILEKIYSNNLIDLVVDSLNLSSVYKEKEIKQGSNDINREQKLKELENSISNTNRYLEYDFQLVEDALESAILSRMLEKPRDEVEGKFDRVLRFSQRVNNQRQLMRIYYQKALTYINYYDDYFSFIENFKLFKTYITTKSSMSEIEDYVVLFTSLYSLKNVDGFSFSDFNLDIENEQKDIDDILKEISQDSERPTTSLMAKTEILFLELLYKKSDVDKIFIELSGIIRQSIKHLDYPFESICKIIEQIYSKIFPDNEEFDNLIDTVALVSSKRNSELESGQIFLRRAIEKFKIENYKESIIYFGKSLMKLAKEETQHEMLMILLGLGISYKNLGLIWASNNCYVTACHISFQTVTKKGSVSEKTYQTIKELLTNELFIGRIPYLFSWYEMFMIFSKVNNQEENSFIELFDATFAIRMLYTSNTSQDIFQWLPQMLEYQLLPLTHDTVLYKQGYIDSILNGQDAISDEKSLDEYFKMLSQQPFVEQMLYDTDFMSDKKLNLYSNISGCEFQIIFEKNIEMLFISETMLAYFESFLATALSNIQSHVERVTINIIVLDDEKEIFKYDEDSNEYYLYIKDFDSIKNIMIEFSTNVIGRNFFISDKKYLAKLFEQDEIYQRLSLIFEYKKSILNILGDKPKLLFEDWINYYKPNKFKVIRQKPLSFNYEKLDTQKNNISNKNEFSNLPHNRIKTYSLINVELWNKAKWKGFGFTFDPTEGIVGIFLAYKNANFAKKIFDEWKKRVGKYDKKELIKIVIIKGINKNNPHWYKVLVTINEQTIKTSSISNFFQTSRVLLMEPSDFKNLNNLIYLFNYRKQYTLFPASMDDNNKVEPFFEKGISKTTLTIKEAWEIGEHDIERMAIQEDDNPIIPNEHKENAPILKILG